MTIETLLDTIIENNAEAYDYHGLPVVTIDGDEWAIAKTDDEADEACAEHIKQSVWAFNANFLADHIEALDAEDIDRLRGDRCEGCNDALLKLIDDEDDFIEAAMSADGRGHFLSPYDGEEVDLGDYYAYRIN